MNDRKILTAYHAMRPEGHPLNDNFGIGKMSDEAAERQMLELMIAHRDRDLARRRTVITAVIIVAAISVVLVAIVLFSSAAGGSFFM
jgi:hypothetical protein